MRGFLLDSHVPTDVVAAVKRIVPECYITRLAVWQEGAFLNESDERILTAAEPEQLIFVTFDVGTIPAIISMWIREGRSCAGVAFVPRSSHKSTDIGGISRALARLFHHPDAIDPAYPVTYLHTDP